LTVDTELVKDSD